MTYPEEFPAGTRIKVSAGPFEGTDYSRYNTMVGTVLRWVSSGFVEIMFDKEPHRTGIIVGHNIQKVK